MASEQHTGENMASLDEPLSPTTTPARHSTPKSTPVLVVLAKLAAFTDAFLSGLLIPLIPTIVREQAGVPKDQVQIWTSVLIAAYGGAFVAASPFLPFFWHKRSSIWISLSAGLILAAVSFALIQTSTGLISLVLARALHGLSGLLITGACAGLMSVSARMSSEAGPLSWVNPTFIQGAAMAVGPAVAGFLHDHLGGLRTVFHYAYAAIVFNALVALLIFKLYGRIRATRQEQRRLLQPEGGAQSYGTMASGQDDTGLSPAAEGLPVSGNTSSLVALGGSIMVTLLFTALQCVLPLEVMRTFKWSPSTVGLLFIALFAPATVINPIANLLVSRAPQSARYLATIGFFASVPAFLYLGRLTQDPSAIRKTLLALLSAISISIGLCAGPLFGNITTSLTARTPLTASERSDVAVQVASIPNIATAWGVLIGPLVAGAVRTGWGWETMAQSLGALSAFSGFAVFFFLNGWIGSSQAYERHNGTSAGDEESAPLLSDSLADAAHSDHSRNITKGGFYERAATYVGTDDSRSLDTSDLGKHRRHFSADNFSISSSIGSHELASVRFHATLDVHDPTSNDQASRRSSRGSSINTERRFLMREAPHAPATDPLLAAGNRYVIDEPRSTAEGGPNGVREKRKRHVVVFPEEEVSPELLQRRKHHVVTINSLDGSFKVAPNPAVDQVSMQISEEMEPASSENMSELRRYVVIVLNEGETGLDVTAGESE